MERERERGWREGEIGVIQSDAGGGRERGGERGERVMGERERERGYRTGVERGIWRDREMDIARKEGVREREVGRERE